MVDCRYCFETIHTGVRLQLLRAFLVDRYRSILKDDEEAVSNLSLGDLLKRYKCDNCISDKPGGAGSGNPAVEMSEIKYHGGRFHSGEW